MRSGQWTPSSRPLFQTSVCVLGGKWWRCPRGDWPPGVGGGGASLPASSRLVAGFARLQGAYELSISGFLKND